MDRPVAVHDVGGLVAAAVPGVADERHVLPLLPLDRFAGWGFLRHRGRLGGRLGRGFARRLRRGLGGLLPLVGAFVGALLGRLRCGLRRRHDLGRRRRLAGRRCLRGRRGLDGQRGLDGHRLRRASRFRHGLGRRFRRGYRFGRGRRRWRWRRGRRQGLPLRRRRVALLRGERRVVEHPDEVEPFGQAPIRPDFRHADLVAHAEPPRRIVGGHRHIEVKRDAHAAEQCPHCGQRLEVVDRFAALDFDQPGQLLAVGENQIREVVAGPDLHGQQHFVAEVHGDVELALAVLVLKIPHQPIVLGLLPDWTDKDRRHGASPTARSSPRYQPNPPVGQRRYGDVS